MKRTKEEDHNWSRMLQQHTETCEQLKGYLRRLEHACENSEDLAAVVRQVNRVALQICREADELSHVLHESPVRRIFSADRLHVTEQQLLFARADGFSCFTAESLGVSPISDYEAYRLCVYEDDEIVWFWHPDQAPPAPARHEGNTVVVHGKAALSPEEIDVAHLRPEQVEFFTKYRPDIIPRLGLLKRHGCERDDTVVLPQGRE